MNEFKSSEGSADSKVSSKASPQTSSSSRPEAPSQLGTKPKSQFKFSVEKYPLMIHVVDTDIGKPKLIIYSPDFDFRMGEAYDSQQMGQTELLIRRMREELEKKIRLQEHLGGKIPSPTLQNLQEAVFGSDLLSSTEAARLLRISRQTLWRMTNEGKISFRRTPGGHRRFVRAEVETLLFNYSF